MLVYRHLASYQQIISGLLKQVKHYVSEYTFSFLSKNNLQLIDIGRSFC